MRLIDADALLITVIKLVNNSVGAECDGLHQCLDAINNAPTVERKPFASVTFNKDELEQIIKDRVIEPIKNGELVVKEERPQGEWIITGEEQGALGITYKIRKCDKCGWEHSLVIPDNFCPNCGTDMRGGRE